MYGERILNMLLATLFSIISLFAGAQPANNNNSTSKHNFKLGEHLDFKLSYGWFTVGKASLDISDNYHVYQNKNCYKVDIAGSTAGFLGVFTHVDDRWGAYVQNDNLLPLHAYRDIEEGKYMREERSYFDQKSGKVTVMRYDPRKTERKPPREYSFKGDIYDLMSSFLYLRNLNFNKYQKGDTITVNTFYEDEFYNFKIRYAGVEELNSKVGDLKAHKMYFMVPESEYFTDKDGIEVWISADANQLPLRIEAEMFFGTGYCELTGYRNIKYGSDFQ